MKKALTLLGKGVLAVLILLVASLLFFWIRNQIYAGGVDDDTVVYLVKNKVDITNGLQPERMLGSDFYRQRVFLLGENHGSADVQQVDQSLLLHLNQKIGLRYYLAELDSIRARHLTRFLTNSSKDTALLKQIVQDVGLRIPQQSSRGLFEKWSAVYDYNQKLPDSLKITVLGIDKDLEDTSRTITRDSAMFLNFKNIVQSRHLENEQFYGLFGFAHVLQSHINQDRTTFAAKVKHADLPFSNAIKSIVCYNLDSEMRLPATGNFPTPPDEKTSLLNADGPITVVKGIKDLKEVTQENTITLFNIEAANSPYRTSQRLIRIKVNLMGEDVLPASESQATTDFFQYVILSRNSNTLTKIE